MSIRCTPQMGQGHMARCRSHKGATAAPVAMATSTNSALSPDVVDLIERYERSAPEPLSSRERRVELCFAIAVTAGAIAIAVGFTSDRSLEFLPLATLL